MSKRYCIAIIPSGGRGMRMESSKPKQFIEICGKPIIAYTLEPFQRLAVVDEIILVVPTGDISYCETHIKDKYGFSKITKIVPGGATRQESVYKGLKYISDKNSIVMVHDGVRPFVGDRIIEMAYTTACRAGSAVAAVKVKDTIKISDDGYTVTGTPKRESLWAAQTPQAFDYRLIAEAYEKALNSGYEGSDDASIVESAEGIVHIVEGDYKNIKITSADDLRYAKYIIESSSIE